MEEILKILEDLKAEKYIKDGWLDNINSELFNSDILTCINNCTSPTGNTKKEKLESIFRAFSIFPMDETKILILGQDPYPSKNNNEGRAHGLAFSFGPKAKKKEADDSLLNIFKAIKEYNKYDKKDIKDWGTNLESWATTNKVLLLNTALTYENDKQQNKHQTVWKAFIKNTIIKLLTCNSGKLVVFLWSEDARKLFHGSIYNEKDNIDLTKKIKRDLLVLTTSHPTENHNAYKKGFCYEAPNHFKACDEFLGEDIWKNFPENNQKNT